MLVPPGDVPALDRATLDGLLSDAGRRERLGEAARRNGRGALHWERNGEATAAVYRIAGCQAGDGASERCA